jgi:hypothetical protein
MTEPTHEQRRERMIERVAKLLRQAEDAEQAGREAEHVAFQEKAFEIMAAYGIDEALARAKQDGLDVKIDAKAASIYLTLQGKYKPMQAHLAHRVARAMHCQAIQLATMGKITLKVDGMPDHLDRFQILWEILVPQAQRGMKHAEPPFGYSHSGQLRVYRRNWLAGFATEIHNRIYKMENAAAAQAGALVLYKSDKERAEIALAADYPQTAKIRSRGSFDSSGYNQGKQAARTAVLQRSL